MLLELFKLPALIVPLLVTEPWLVKESAVISFPLLLINSLPVSLVIVDAIIEPLLVNVPLLSIVPLSGEEPMLPLFMNLSLLIISSEIILLPELLLNVPLFVSLSVVIVPAVVPSPLLKIPPVVTSF